MSDAIEFPIECPLPPLAAGAVEIVRVLGHAGHQALLAGGCVRDLLLGSRPEDYDVATDAPPDRVCGLFRKTRRVGAQFGVVLVRRRGRWIEVATFRSDGPYLDGRHPSSVTLSDARHDAQRRDFTVNGMFLDPLRAMVIDYVGGRADLAARVIRAIGEPAARFAEDYLRLLRAARLAARLGFPIEPDTLAAIRAHADKLPHVAAERIREELQKMLAAPTRQRAWRLLEDCRLLPHLWPGAAWSPPSARAIDTLLGRVPARAPFELALAIMLQDCDPAQIAHVARSLALSNEQWETTAWLVAHRGDLDDPQTPSLADLKRLMANPAFDALRMWAAARHEDLAGAGERQSSLETRVAAVPPDAVQPPPLVRGDDLHARNVPPGPIYAEILEALYTRQLNEQLTSREEALQSLDRMLADRGRPTR